MVALTEGAGHLFARRPDDGVKNRLVLEKLLIACKQLSVQLADGDIICLFDREPVSGKQVACSGKQQKCRNKSGRSHVDTFLFQLKRTRPAQLFSFGGYRWL